MSAASEPHCLPAYLSWFLSRRAKLTRSRPSVPTRGKFSKLFTWPLEPRSIIIKQLNVKKLISLQHRERAMKSHIKNSKNHFFWDNVLARSHIALTIHLTLPHLTFALPHYHASKETSKEKNASARTVIMSSKLLLFSVVFAVARITYTVLVETLNHAQSAPIIYSITNLLWSDTFTGVTSSGL